MGMRVRQVVLAAWCCWNELAGLHNGVQVALVLSNKSCNTQNTTHNSKCKVLTAQSMQEEHAARRCAPTAEGCCSGGPARLQCVIQLGALCLLTSRRGETELFEGEHQAGFLRWNHHTNQLVYDRHGHLYIYRRLESNV